MRRAKPYMLNIKKTLNTLSTAFMYYFLVAFMPLFLINLILRQLLWPFFSYSLYIPVINFLIDLAVLYLAVRYISDPVYERVPSDQKRLLFFSALIIFVMVIGLTTVVNFADLNTTEKIMQIVFSVSYVALFAFFSYNKSKLINT